MTLDQLELGQKAIIIDVPIKNVPLKLLEMGCLPGNDVTVVQMAPFYDPIYLNINGSHLAIRKKTAKHILIDLINE